MRGFRFSKWRSRGSLMLFLSVLLFPLTCPLLLAASSHLNIRNFRHPIFDPATLTSSPKQQIFRHRGQVPFFSLPAPPPSEFSSVPASINADIHAVDASSFPPPPLSASAASVSPLPSVAAAAEAPPPSPTGPPPPSDPRSDQRPPDSPPSFTTRVAPVRLSTAAAPAPQSAEQLAPILRGVCNIPAFNPCVPIAECVPSVPVIGEATCICPPGYVGDGFVSSQGCNDINECATGQHNCDTRTMICIDTPGSFRCECLRGFSIAPNGRTCLDIDECQNPALNDCDPLTMKCHNLEGTYKCVCDNPQQIMDEVTRQCRDLNECEDLGGIMNPCEQLCEDRVGGFRCSCRDGYRLAPDGVSCLDVDECANPLLNSCDPAGVISRCENVVGGYRCICNEALGFDNGPDGVGCVNLDECTRDPYICGGALSCCKDLFPPQRFACTVPVDDALGHTPPLGGITAYGINAALGGSSLTNWIPGFLGLDAGGTLAFPRGLWRRDLLLPLFGIAEAADGTAVNDGNYRPEQDEGEKTLDTAANSTGGAGGRVAGGQLESKRYEAPQQNIEAVPLKDGRTSRPQQDIIKNSEEQGSGKVDELPRAKKVNGKDSMSEVNGKIRPSSAGVRIEGTSEGRNTGDYRNAEEVEQRLSGQEHREQEEGAESEQQVASSTHAVWTALRHLDAVDRTEDDTEHSEICQENSGVADTEPEQEEDQHVYVTSKEKESELTAVVGGTRGSHASFERHMHLELLSDGGENRWVGGSLQPDAMVVIAGNSSTEEIREKLRRIEMLMGAFTPVEDKANLGRRRLQLLTALKPGSPYLPGSQLGPIGGIRFGRGATCPAGFRLGGDLYREKVRTKMKNTFEYLLTSNVKTNPDGSRRVVSPQEVAAGVLSNAHLVSDEATKWYNEFVRLPSAIAPALHIGTSAAMDVGRQAALQQLLNS